MRAERECIGVCETRSSVFNQVRLYSHFDGWEALDECEEPRFFERYDPEVFSEKVRDRRGVPRLKLLREAVEEFNADLSVLTETYEEWVSVREFIRLKVYYNDDVKPSEIITLECRKRGNGLYRWWVRRRLEWLNDLKNIEFFNPNSRDGGKHTCVLFITLTYDTNRCDYKTAWENIGREFNRWLSAVRRKFGKVGVFRVFEATKNGYPHIHLILLLQKPLPVVNRRYKNTWRIPREFQRVFVENWHSFVDIQAVPSIRPITGYLKKYLLKTLGDVKIKGVKVDGKTTKTTLALLWFFRKRSFSVSRDFAEMLNITADLTPRGTIQTPLCHFLPVPAPSVRYELMLSPSGYRTWTLDELPDPPPDASYDDDNTIIIICPMVGRVPSTFCPNCPYSDECMRRGTRWFRLLYEFFPREPFGGEPQ